MRNGSLGLVTTLLAGALALAQPPVPTPARPEPIPAPRAAVPPASPAPVPDDTVFTDAPCWPGASESLPARFWAEGEYLLWWVKPGPLTDALLTTGPAASLGILSNAGTQVVFGRGDFDYGAFNGGRFTLGSWLGANRIVGVEGSGFFLEEDSSNFSAASDAAGDPLLARPIINAVTGNESAVTVASPGAFAGSFDATSVSKFWGFEGNAVVSLIRQGGTGIDLLAGFRFLNLQEQLDIDSRSAPLPGGGFAFFNGNPVLAPNSVAVRDSFATRNQFYGGQLGVRGRVQGNRLSVDCTGKVAFGAVHQYVRAAGSTALLDADGNVTAQANGGLLVLPTNAGKRGDTDGAIVPELGVRVGFQVTQRVTVMAGYTIIYFDNVLRPGDQISRQINLTQVPSSAFFGPLTGPARPTPLFEDSRFWAQGVNVGLAIRY